MVALSPALRALLAVVVAGAAAALTVLTDGFQIEDAFVILIAGLGALGIVPPQVGGTQEGVVNPSVKP